MPGFEQTSDSSTPEILRQSEGNLLRRRILGTGAGGYSAVISAELPRRLGWLDRYLGRGQSMRVLVQFAGMAGGRRSETEQLSRAEPN
jgi:hypothetical protein